MNNQEFIDNLEYLQISKDILRCCGVNNAIILSLFLDKRRQENSELFIYRMEEIVSDSHIEIRNVRSSINFLKEKGIIEITKKGMPLKNFYSINLEKIQILISNFYQKSINNDNKTEAIYSHNVIDNEKKDDCVDQKNDEFLSQNDEKNENNEEKNVDKLLSCRCNFALSSRCNFALSSRCNFALSSRCNFALSRDLKITNSFAFINIYNIYIIYINNNINNIYNNKYIYKYINKYKYINNNNKYSKNLFSLDVEEKNDDSVIVKKKIRHDYTDNFSHFWDLYKTMRSDSKNEAFKQWQKLIKEYSENKIIDSLKKQIKIWEINKIERKFIPHARTWLYQKRFLDDFDSDPFVKKSIDYLLKDQNGKIINEELF